MKSARHTSTEQPEARDLAYWIAHTTDNPTAALIQSLHARVQELETGLKKANAQAEHFEREWYLRGDELEASQAQRVPLSDDVLRDAARYRFLAVYCRSTSEHWGGRWSIIVDGPAPKSHDSEDDFDAAIDAAQAKHGEKP